MNNVEEAIKTVEVNEISAVSLAKELLDGKEQIRVSLERKKVMPERMESPSRAHEFHDKDGFIKFLQVNKTDNTIIFADVEEVSITAILDDKAQKGFEWVTLRPPYHPQFEMLDDTLLDKTLKIANFAAAVMRNREIIKASGAYSAKDIALIMQQITIASETTQFIGDGKTAVNGIVTKTKISAGAVAENQLQIPDSFNVQVPIYINTLPQLFPVDITISSNRGEVFAVVDCPELKVKKYEVFRNIMDEIELAAAGIMVVYGKSLTRSWDYNK